MKKLKVILGVLLIFLIITPSCKKDSLQPSCNPFKKETVVLEELKAVDENIKEHENNARTTQGVYYWAPDTLTLNGPVGYSPLYNRSANEFCYAFRYLLMPDTTKLTIDNEQSRINKVALDLRRENTENETWKKMRLEVETDVYEICPRLGERFLTAEMEYITTELCGNADWYSGTRSLAKEKAIAMLPYTPDTDFQDPWGCNCSPYTYILEYYKEYAEGDQKSAVDRTKYIELVQSKSAEERYQKLSSYDDGTFEYETKYDEEREVYYLDISIPAYKK
jgi:hypothetical protein